MATQDKRGSEKLLDAWKSRALTEDAVHEIANALAQSPARVECADVVGGADATGVRLSLRYDGDDLPSCGNDILFWLPWHLSHGGVVRPPRIIIDGIPYPDLLRMDLDFGHIDDRAPGPRGPGGGFGGLGGIGGTGPGGIGSGGAGCVDG